MGKFALYLSFFPKFLAGPIERAENLLPQISSSPQLNTSKFLIGTKRILWGVFKKLIIADKLALLVNIIYSAPDDYNGWLLLAAAYLFAFQIYCDFSGYCDIAIGIAQIFGYKLSENFNKPYFAESISDFWRRWHLTLTSWLKDYVYISLGGNRVSPIRWKLNIIIVFLLSGLWHGIGWNYIVWGGINGFLYLAESMTKTARETIAFKIGLVKKEKFYRFLRIAVTFNFVSLGWIIFREKEIGKALFIIKKIFSDIFSKNLVLFSYNKYLELFDLEIFMYLFLLSIFIVNERFGWIEKYLYHENPNDITINELIIINSILILLILLGETSIPFYYFQF